VPTEPVPLTWLFNYVRPFSVRVTSTSGGRHVPSSFHYIHRAVDVAGPAPELARLFRQVLRHPGLFTEAFYDPAGRYVKRGVIHRGSIGGHTDHVHLAR
jgi:hypothetical protein